MRANLLKDFRKLALKPTARRGASCPPPPLAADPDDCCLRRVARFCASDEGGCTGAGGDSGALNCAIAGGCSCCEACRCGSSKSLSHYLQLNIQFKFGCYRINMKPFALFQISLESNFKPRSRQNARILGQKKTNFYLLLFLG